MEELNVKTGGRHEPGEYKGRPFKGDDELDLMAEGIVAQLRSVNMPIWQAKDVLKRAIRLLDWELLK